MLYYCLYSLCRVLHLHDLYYSSKFVPLNPGLVCQSPRKGAAIVKNSMEFPEKIKNRSVNTMCACVLSCFRWVWLCSPPGSSVHGILKGRILEWFALSSCRESSRPRDWTCISDLLLWQVVSLPVVPPGKHH